MTNKLLIAERGRRWEQEHLEKGLCAKCNRKRTARSKRFCRRHLLLNRARSKKNHARYRDWHNAWRRVAGHRARVKLMLSLGGMVCAWCGERDYRVLTVDHINGHDAPVKARKARRNGLTPSDAKAIACGEKTLSEFRVLCASCQVRYEHVRGRRVIPLKAAELIEASGGVLPALSSYGGTP